MIVAAGTKRVVVNGIVKDVPAGDNQIATATESASLRFKATNFFKKAGRNARKASHFLKKSR